MDVLLAAAEPPIFGACPPDVVCHDRRAAYAVIREEDGRVAAVCARAACWLPGGGSLPGESPEDTVIREVREELGRSVRLLARIGEALQFFYAAEEERWYRMSAVFFHAEFADGPVAAGEHELCWLDPNRNGVLFFHTSHAWAVGLSCESRRRVPGNEAANPSCICPPPTAFRR
jgi:8-oxo-dGTP pyrophosphatase MutT (NUDIX family)